MNEEWDFPKETLFDFIAIQLDNVQYGCLLLQKDRKIKR